MKPQVQPEKVHQETLGTTRKPQVQPWKGKPGNPKYNHRKVNQET